MKRPARITEAIKRQEKAIRNNPITSTYDDLTDENAYRWHSWYFTQCARELTMRVGRTFIIDNRNVDVMKFLLYYFNRCPKMNEPNEYKDERYKRLFANADMDKNIMLIGSVGTGKTLLMQAFALYLERTRNPMAYTCTSVTELLNYYKVNEHLDYWTYNAGRNSAEGKPIAVCLNDVGLETMKHYGNDLQSVIDEYFHARNEVYTQWGLRNHITSNLDKKQILELFADPYKRLEDRFKTYNIIPLMGNSRR